MKRNNLERLDPNQFAQLSPFESLDSVAGYTALLTYKPTLVNGVADTVISDVRTDA
ncbi:MAG TPA: hypothetical protein VI756_31140 [Blastocatellia bacterium]